MDDKNAAMKVIYYDSMGGPPDDYPIKSPCEKSAALATPTALQTFRWPWVLIVTILASSMAILDGTAVNAALPSGGVNGCLPVPQRSISYLQRQIIILSPRPFPPTHEPTQRNPS